MAKSDVYPTLVQTIQSLEADVCNGICVEKMSRATGLSQAQFSKEFFNAFGTTPNLYLQSVRLAKAKELVAISELSLENICYEVGFETFEHFSKLFRAEFGTGPERYRAMISRSPAKLIRI